MGKNCCGGGGRRTCITQFIPLFLIFPPLHLQHTEQAQLFISWSRKTELACRYSIQRKVAFQHLDENPFWFYSFDLKISSYIVTNLLKMYSPGYIKGKSWSEWCVSLYHFGLCWIMWQFPLYISRYWIKQDSTWSSCQMPSHSFSLICRTELSQFQCSHPPFNPPPNISSKSLLLS